MPSSLLSNLVATRSTQGEVIVPFFAPDGLNKFGFYNPYWYMENGWESIGATEDEMTFRVQAQNVNNYSFDVVLNPDGPLATIKFDTPVVGVRYYEDSNGKNQYDVIFAGFVKSIRQKSENSLQYVKVTATSVKKILRDITVRGSYCWDGEKVTYLDAIPLHMNSGGRPDWTFSTDGIPMPALNPDWGIFDDEEPIDPSERPTDSACYCTLGMLLQYLCAAYGAGGSGSESFEAARDDARRFFTALDRLPDTFPFNFIWPTAFGQQVDQNIVNNFNNAVGQNNTSQGGARKGRDIKFRNGQPLIGNVGEIGVLDTIFAECGGFSYAIGYGDINANEDTDGSIDVFLKCVPTRLFDSIQSLPIFYAGGNETDIGDKLVVRELDYVESCDGTFTRMNGIGSSVKIEQRVETNDTDILGVLYGFTDEDFQGFRTDSVVGGQTSEVLMYKALKKYPHLFSRFCFEPDFDPQFGTAYEEYPLVKAARPVWPFLLSFQGAAINTQATDIVPYPVRLEVDTAGDGVFLDAGIESDGFISWNNGYFEFQTLRDVGINRNDLPADSKRRGIFTWGSGGWGSVVNGKLDISLNNLRVTVAIPIDATLNYALKTPADSTIKDDESLYTNAPDSPDAFRFDSRFTRTMTVDLSRLYDLWLRIDSYPVPESAGGTLFSYKLSIQDAVRSDYKLLVQNVNKMLYERNRLQRSGYFRYTGKLIPPQVYPLGQQINSIFSTDPDTEVSPFELNCCIQRRSWSTKNLGTGDKPKWVSATDLMPI